MTGNSYIGDAYKCFDGTIYEEENLRMAELYWENGQNEDGHQPIVEISKVTQMAVSHGIAIYDIGVYKRKIIVAGR